MVPRRFSRGMVNSVKNVVDTSGQLTGATQSVTDVTATVAAQTTQGGNEVTQGSKVFAFFISIFVLGSSGSTSGLVDWYIWKNVRSAIPSASIPVPGATGTSPLRNYIIHEEKGLSATQDGTPMVFKGVIKVPRHLQRNAADDKWQIRLLSETGNDADFCIKVIYKFFR